MYNGIGLETPRGSGTNAYVQKNLSLAQHGSFQKQRDQEIVRLEEQKRRDEVILFRGPNKEILEHERKRRIEVKCTELEDMMEEQGYLTEEISKKVHLYRLSLQKADEEFQEKKRNSNKASLFGSNLIEVDDVTGRERMQGSHEQAAVKVAKVKQFREALGISDNYIPGTSMHQQEERDALKVLKAKETADKEKQKRELLLQERAKQMLSESNFMILDDSSEDEHKVIEKCENDDHKNTNKVKDNQLSRRRESRTTKTENNDSENVHRELIDRPTRKENIPNRYHLQTSTHRSRSPLNKNVAKHSEKYSVTESDRTTRHRRSSSPSVSKNNERHASSNRNKRGNDNNNDKYMESKGGHNLRVNREDVNKEEKGYAMSRFIPPFQKTSSSSRVADSDNHRNDNKKLHSSSAATTITSSNKKMSGRREEQKGTTKKHRYY